MKELLKLVIEGKETLVDLPFTPLSEINEVLKELEIDIEDTDTDQNGGICLEV